MVDLKDLQWVALLVVVTAVMLAASMAELSAVSRVDEMAAEMVA